MDKFFSFFVGRFKGDPEEYTRAKLVVKFTIVELVSVLIDIVFYKYFNFHVPFFLFVGFGITLIATLFLFRFSIPLTIMANVMIGTMWAGFAWGVSISGGIFSVLIPWLVLMPIMGNLLVGNRCAKYWFAVSSLSVVFFMFFFKNPHAMVDPLGDRRAFISYFALGAVIFALTDLYHRAEVKLLNRIKDANHDLAASNEEILAQNDSLAHQRDELSAQRNFIERQNGMLLNQNKHIESVNEQLAMRVKEIFERNQMLEKHWHTLLDISKNKEVCFGDLDVALKHICKTASNSLKVNRVSVWRYQAERKSIQCLVLFELEEDRFLIEEELLATDFPNYFEALLEEDVIPADEAETDVHTYEFREVYLRPHHIVSMMDTPFFLEGKLGGVLCCEQKQQRHWLPEDIIFAQALSDIITLVFRTQQRRQYETSLRQQRKEIERINQSLEAKVKERTTLLEEQNNQLAEYAFINSHILRGPVCRILGLINLLEYQENKEQQLIDHLKLSGEELDEVVKKINNSIAEGGHFNREKFGKFRQEFE